ncbi:MAG: carbohydrate ABC transporter permease [Clostridium sp.]|uniref:carbohydrate ABC transporter permease n=1 Tax=Clostridium sp. TaxID=1506 RepID=UPI003D6CE02F
MKKNKTIFKHITLIVCGLILIYPFIWLVFAALKPSKDVMTTINLLPKKIMFSNITQGWNIITGRPFGIFIFNSFLLTIGCLVGSLIVSSLTAFAFARLDFRLKKPLFTILIGTLLLPPVTTLIPRYIMFTKAGITDSYLPFWIPSLLGAGVGGGFFIFLMVQFMRGLPKELDEAAKIDGCNTFQIFYKIILPLCKPVLFTVGIFAFMWNWDDFQNQLIYITGVDKLTVPLALRMTIDNTGIVSWGPILAISLITLLPSIIIFFSAQKYFVDGVISGGIKG